MNETEFEKMFEDRCGDRLEEFNEKMDALMVAPSLAEVAAHLGLTMSELASSPNFEALKESASIEVALGKFKKLFIEYGLNESEADTAIGFVRKNAGI